MQSKFFSPDSFWNQPIDPDAETDPLSDEMVALMDERWDEMYLNMVEYTIPIYEVDQSTPMRRIHQRGPEPDATGAGRVRQERYSMHPDFGPEIPIPEDAMPDPARDSHMALVDWENRRAWDMWHARLRPDGEWETATGMAYSLDSTGVWKTEDFPIKNGESMHFHGPSRAAGVPAIAGLVLEQEVRAGRIEHKLSFASSNVCQQFVWPATWTDGGREQGPLEGCVLQLDPGLDLDGFDLSPGARVIARAMQEYGAVNVDGARGNCIYAEGLYGHADRSWDDIMAPDDLRCIPMEHYRILKLENIVHKGDPAHRRKS